MRNTNYKNTSWSIGINPDVSLANGMLERACAILTDSKHRVIHADRCCHYRWPG